MSHIGGQTFLIGKIKSTVTLCKDMASRRRLRPIMGLCFTDKGNNSYIAHSCWWHMHQLKICILARCLLLSQRPARNLPSKVILTWSKGLKSPVRVASCMQMNEKKKLKESERTSSCFALASSLYLLSPFVFSFASLISPVDSSQRH